MTTEGSKTRRNHSAVTPTCFTNRAQNSLCVFMKRAQSSGDLLVMISAPPAYPARLATLQKLQLLRRTEQ